MTTSFCIYSGSLAINYLDILKQKWQHDILHGGVHCLSDTHNLSDAHYLSNAY